MPIKKIGIKKYVWRMNRARREHHIGVDGMHARNPFYKKWRKVPADSCDISLNPFPGCTCFSTENFEDGCCKCETYAKGKNLVQEVFKEAIPPLSCQACVDKNGKCIHDYKIRIRSGMLQTNMQMKDPCNPTKQQNSYNYNYKQYLQKRCKTIYQNSFNFTPSNPENNLPNSFRANCACNKIKPTSGNCGGVGAGSGVDCSCPVVTYKPNNKRFSTQGAVDSSTRLQLLKYNAVTKNGRDVAGSYRHASCSHHNMIKSRTCQERVIGAGKRIFRSGGRMRPPRCTTWCQTPAIFAAPSTLEGKPFSQKPNPEKCERTCAPGVLSGECIEKKAKYGCC